MATTLPGFKYLKSLIQFISGHPHKNTFYPSTVDDGSNVISLTRSGNQVEDYTTHNCMEYEQDSDNDQIINIRWYMSGIIHALLDVNKYCKFQINTEVSSDSTDGETHCLYRAYKKTKSVRRYMESPDLPTVSLTVHWKDNTICIYAVENKRFMTRVKCI